jgi:hypothetical protein
MKIYFFFSCIILFSCNPKSEQSINTDLNEVPKESMITHGDTTGNLMKEDEFWKIIEDSQTPLTENYEGQINNLKGILKGFDEGEIVKFNNTFYTISGGANNWDLWGASYVINGGCSDDCFDYFREYLIAKGKSKFYKTLKDPDSCADWIKTEAEENWEGIRYCAYEVYKEKTGKEIPVNVKFEETKGTPFEEATLYKKFPKLSIKFSGGDQE